MCSSFQFQMNQKESVICKLEMFVNKSLCCSFNLSNDDIIFVLCKHVMLSFVTTSRSENGPSKSTSEIIAENLILATLDEGKVYKEESLTTKQRHPPRSYSLLLPAKVKMFV